MIVLSPNYADMGTTKYHHEMKNPTKASFLFISGILAVHLGCLWLPISCHMSTQTFPGEAVDQAVQVDTDATDNPWLISTGCSDNFPVGYVSYIKLYPFVEESQFVLVGESHLLMSNCWLLSLSIPCCFSIFSLCRT